MHAKTVFLGLLALIAAAFVMVSILTGSLQAGMFIGFLFLVFAPFALFHYLPTIALYGILAWLIARVLRHTRLRRPSRVWLSLGLALLAGVIAAQSFNTTLNAQVSDLMAGDHAEKPTKAPAALALWFADTKEDETGCGRICILLLTTSEVEKILIVSAPQGVSPPPLDQPALSYRLEARPACPRNTLLSANQSFLNAGATGLDLAFALGHCLVVEPATLVEADGVLTRFRLAGDGGTLTFPPFGETHWISVQRDSYFERQDQGWLERQRSTEIRWLSQPWLVTPVFRFFGQALVLGSQYNHSGWVDRRLDGYDLSRLKLSTQKEPALSLVQDRVDTVLQFQGNLTAGEAALTSLWLDRIFQGHLPDYEPAVPLSDADRARVIGIAGDPRLPLTKNLDRLIDLAAPLPPETAAHLAEISVERLTRLLVLTADDLPVGWGMWRFAQQDQIKYATQLIAALPPIAFAPYLDHIERIIDEKSRFETGLIVTALAAQGEAAAPRLFAILISHEYSIGSYEREKSALRGLCLLGKSAAPVLPDLLAALKDKRLGVDVYNKYDLMLNTLIALGVTRKDLESLRRLSRSANPEQTRFETALQAATSAKHCPLR